MHRPSTGTLEEGGSGTETLCAYDGIECYQFEVDGESEYNSEIFWSLTNQGGTVVEFGQHTTSVQSVCVSTHSDIQCGMCPLPSNGGSRVRHS